MKMGIQKKTRLDSRLRLPAMLERSDCGLGSDCRRAGMTEQINS